LDGAVDELPRLPGHAEGTVLQAGGDIFRGAAAKGDFDVVDGGGAVHGEGGDPALAHQVDEEGREAALDDVAADADGDRLFCSDRRGEVPDEVSEVGADQDFGQTPQEAADGSARPGRIGKTGQGDLAGTLGERSGLDL